METNQAREALDQARRLEAAGRRSGRWMVWWYLGFGAATLVFAAALAVGGPLGFTLGTAIWAGAITALAVTASRQKASFRGMSRLHGWVIAIWALIWGATVLAGVTIGPAGYLTGGVACLLVALAGAFLVHRRTR